MIEVNLYKDKLVGLFGLGITGIAAYRALEKGGSKVIIWDDNVKTREKFVEKSRKYFNENKLRESFVDLNDERWQKTEAIVLSPGVPTYYPQAHKVVQIAKKYNIKIINDIELLYLSNRCANIIAITGTNGKSTTTSLIHHILTKANYEAQVGGNIGTSVLDLKKLRVGGNYVVECSSFQLEITDKFKPKISILLNITSDHQDRYKNIDDYIAAKMRVFSNQNKSDIAIINVDNEVSRFIYNSFITRQKFKKLIPFSTKKKLDEGVYSDGKYIICNYDQKYKIKMPQNNHSLKGEHNIENMAAACAAAISMGVEPSIIEKFLGDFVGLPHRMEFIGEINGVSFINDSKATNPESVEKALKTYKNILWIAGGYPKGKFDSDVLYPYYLQLKKTYLIGKSAEMIEDSFPEKMNYEHCFTLANAVRKAFSEAKKGDVILLSPAFASFDQFNNYQHRGDCFRELFLKLSKSNEKK